MATRRRRWRRTPPIRSGEWDLHSCTCTVYRIYDRRGTLLYVGIAENLGRRIGEHLRTAPWSSQAASVEWDEYEDRHRAEEVEGESIGALKPLYNNQGNRHWDAKAIPLGPVPWRALPPAVRARHARATHRRLALGDRL